MDDNNLESIEPKTENNENNNYELYSDSSLDSNSRVDVPENKNQILCPKCGTLISNESMFCNNCGKKLVTDDRKNLINKRNATICGGIIGVILLGFLIKMVLYNPVSNFKSDINANNCIRAMKVYNEKIKGNADKEATVRTFLIDDINKIYNSFVEEKIDYQKAFDLLNTIDHTGLVFDEISKINAKLAALNTSRTAYKNAENYLGKNEFLNALVEYKKVIPEDKNYKKAQEQIASNEKKYQEQIQQIAQSQKVIAESASIIIQDTRWKALYPDMIQVVVKNMSDKTVKTMHISCLGYDQNGYPVKIKTQFDYSGGDYEFVGVASDANIVPGATFGEGRGWSLDESHDISTPLACVKDVTFYDGTTWDNPYYKYWIEQHKEKPLNQ